MEWMNVRRNGVVDMNRVKKALAAVLFVILVIGIAGCGSQTSEVKQAKKTVKIAYLPITHAVPLFVEEENIKNNVAGLENVDIELVKFGSWPELVDALNSGKVDGASILIELAMKAKEQGIDLKVAGLGHRDGNNVTVAQDINSTADLKGKTVAVPQRFSTQNILLYKMLKDANLRYEDVTVVELSPSEMPAALSEGRIAGYIVAEPFGSKSVIAGKGKILYESKALWLDSICCGLVLRNDFIQHNRDTAKKLVEGYVKAGQEAEAKDEKIQKIAARYMSVDKKILEASLQYTSYVNLKLSEKDYEQLTTYLTEMGLSKNPPKYSEFVDTTLIN